MNRQFVQCFGKVPLFEFGRTTVSFIPHPSVAFHWEAFVSDSDGMPIGIAGLTNEYGISDALSTDEAREFIEKISKIGG